MSTNATANRSSLIASATRLDSQAAASARTASAAREARLALEGLAIAAAGETRSYYQQLAEKVREDELEYAEDATDRRTRAEILRQQAARQ